MERQLLKHKELSVNQNDPNSDRFFKFWLRAVQDFIEGLIEIRGDDQPAINCKRIVISCLSAEVFPFVEYCDTYEEIIATLRNIYVKPTNNVFARYLLVSRNEEIIKSVYKTIYKHSWYLLKTFSEFVSIYFYCCVC